jgi:murein DD-endopeptidase MepM/ murein hydrolase activator NlpD
VWAAGGALLIAGTLSLLPITSPNSSVISPGPSGGERPGRDFEAELPATPQVMLVSAYHMRMRERQDGAGEARLEETTLKVEPGDTLMGLLIGAGAERGQAHEAIQALSEVFSPRKLRVGQEVAVTFRTQGGAVVPASASDEALEREAPDGLGEAARSLMSIRLRPSVEQDVEVALDEGESTFVARAIERQLEAEPRYATGTIDSSLFAAADEAGVPHAVLVDAIRTFSFDVDFQRDIQEGDSFQLVYDGFRDDSGRFVKSGDILFAELVLSGKPIRLYRFTPESGVTDYFNEKGQSVRKTLLRTPVDGARVSSTFGMRKHPVLGYSKMHKGIDFAAPPGTPIYAAGDGVVEKASRWGGYGNYVRIRHNSTYKSAYAHMQKFGKGIRAGTRVKQGQVIGYVGTTGRSTGPHLHYEVLVDDAQVNPRSIKLPAGEVLAGADLEAFREEMAHIDGLRTGLAAAPQLASGE